MERKGRLFAALAAAALVGVAPALAHHDGEDWRGPGEKGRAEKWRGAKGRGYRGDDGPPWAVYRRRARPPATGAPAGPHAAPRPQARTPSDFPRESPAQRSAANERQRDILEKELAAEQELLDDARLRLAETDIAHHEQNIEALQRELKHLQR